jgi:hypothetical protein
MTPRDQERFAAMITDFVDGTLMTTIPQKITFGELRASGVRVVLIYCRDHRCSHHVETNAKPRALTRPRRFALVST